MMVDEDKDVILETLHKKKRMRSENESVLLDEIHNKLPYLFVWPASANEQDHQKIVKQYDHYETEPTLRPNRVVYTSIILGFIKEPYLALGELRVVGAFATRLARKTLLSVLFEAKIALPSLIPSSVDDTLDESIDILERYTKYGFSLEEDGVTVGCGTIPLGS